MRPSVQLLTAFLALASSDNMQMFAAGLAPDSSSHPNCTLIVQSDPESARVVIDGTFLGYTPLAIDSLRPGIHILTLQHPNMESWLTEPIRDTMQLAIGADKALRYNFRSRHSITSSPFGAEVVLGDSVIGTTPIITSSELIQGTLLLRKPGYEQ